MVYLVWDNYFNDKKNDAGGSEGQEAAQVDGGGNDKELEKDEEATEKIEKERVPQYDGDDPNVSEALTGAITYAGVNGGKLIVRVNIDQYLEEGTCGLVLSRGGAELYSESASVVGGPSTSTCEGFDVPVDELGNGEVRIIVNLESGSKKGEIMGGVTI